MKPQRILVPVKGDPIDDEALQLACALAGGGRDGGRGRARVTVEIIYVIEVPRALPLDADLPDEVLHGEEALSHAEQFAATLAPEVIVETEVLQARTVGTAIVDEATERRADLIVMAARHRRRLGEFNMGLTLPYVLKNAQCRVLVARAPASVEAITAVVARPALAAAPHVG